MLDLGTTLSFAGAIQVAVAIAVIAIGVPKKPSPGLLQWEMSFALAAAAFILGYVQFVADAGRTFADLLLVVEPLQVEGFLLFCGMVRWRGWRGINAAMAVTFIVLAVIVRVLSYPPEITVAVASAGLAAEAVIGLVALSSGARPWRYPALKVIFACFSADALFGIFQAGAALSPLSHDQASTLGPMAATGALICTLVLLLKAFGVIAATAQRTEEELRMLSRDLEHQASTDPLTKLRNRRSFYELGGPLVALAQRHDRPLTALMVDIDRFKQVNDTHGHAGGDQVLVTVAETMTRMLRTSDLIGRLGGEEFGILLVETSQRAAELTAERLRRGIAALHPKLPVFEGLTISIGLAPLLPDTTGLDAVLEAADQALYRAKREGRNRWVVAA